LHALEQRYHSLIVGQVLGARERRRRGEASKQNAKKVSFDEGLQVLTDQLGARLGASVRLNARVEGVRRSGDGWSVSARVGPDADWRDYEAVLFAGTAPALAKLLISADHVPDLAPLREVYYPPVASVVLGFRREEVAHPLDGFGMLIPEVEKFNSLGTLFSSSLFPNRAPAGHVLLTSYLGGARNPGLASKDADTMVGLVMADLRTLLGVTGRPTFVHHCVYPQAIPQYEVGYGRFKELMSHLESACPGFFLAGHYRDGISLGDSIVSAHHAADRISAHLARATASPQLQVKAAA
jgi:oxygen-dependent protoporphyrinogen oxidase